MQPLPQSPVWRPNTLGRLGITSHPVPAPGQGLPHWMAFSTRVGYLLPGVGIESPQKVLEGSIGGHVQTSW